MTKSRREVTETPDVSHVKNIDVTHEPSDVKIGAILTFVGLLTLASIAICVGLYFLFWFYNRTEDEREPKPGPMAMTKEAREQRLPPEPRLQNAPGFGLKLENGQWVNLEKREPAAEYQELRKQWEQTLREGLKDDSNKVVGMPIEEAMKIIAQGNRLPTRGEPGSAAKSGEEGIRLPTAASSGRVSELVR